MTVEELEQAIRELTVEVARLSRRVMDLEQAAERRYQAEQQEGPTAGLVAYYRAQAAKEA
jgi:prefoldin subunit 5